MSAIRLTDSTLRDGSHSVRHSFTGEQVARVATLLAAGRVPVIEVAHGDGLGGSSFNYGFSQTDERTLIRAVVEAAPEAIIATLLLPGIGLATDLAEVAALGVGLVRVATHCTEADIAAEHIHSARDAGLEVHGLLMLSHMLEPQELLEQAKVLESFGAHGVYVVDSAGALVPSTACTRVAALRDGLEASTAVGFHAHDNLGCGVGNTLAAIDVGATLVDASLAGLGAGAGNMATESFAAAAERSGLDLGLDVLALAAAADEITAMLGVHARRDGASLTVGYAGVYSSFLLHAERAAERFGVPVGEILLELGDRKVVGGQEDMILDVAAELAGRTVGSVSS
jgi:4-hydroxy-2-oxovalerate aldolase